MTDERDKIRFNMSLSTGRLVRVLTAVSSILSITLIPTNAVAQDKEAWHIGGGGRDGPKKRCG